ncbi:hypothetical protein FQN52_000213 [Onygenales sp. PD_12]|nr:hypothetical protein FQN52_000213 [Onygenales sp. PD_12]
MPDVRGNFDWGEARRRRASGETDAIRDMRSNRPELRNLRGGGNWRGAAGGHGHRQWQKPSKSPLEQPIGKLVAKITINTSTEKEGPSPKITECELVGSYNWIDRQAPVIAIPGAPPKWTPLRHSIQLREDSGEFFRDPNSARWPVYPMEPAIRAVFDRNPDFNGNKIDVVACGGTLGHLLKFASSKSWDFQFGAHLIGETLFLVRKETTPKALIEGIYGYGHTFPEAYTSWDRSVKGSSTSQRIVRYKFGGMTFMIRFEVDGYLGDLATTNVGKDRDKTAVAHGSSEIIDLLTQNVEGVTIINRIQSKATILNVENAGFDVPQAAIFDLKTRTINKEIDINDVLPRLWARQIPNLITAKHNRGRFDESDIEIRSVKQDIDDWEEKNGKRLKQLSEVIHRLIEKLKKSKAKNLLVRRAEDGPLELWETVDISRSALPTNLAALWKRAGEESDDEDGDDDYLLF